MTVKISEPGAPDYKELEDTITREIPAMDSEEVKVLATEAFYLKFIEWFYKKSEEKLSEEKADNLAASIIQATREHPLLLRGASVRGTLALREIARGYEQLIGRLNRFAIAQSALIALPHRVMVVSGIEKNGSDIIKEITLEVLYGITFPPEYLLSEEGLTPKDSLKEMPEGSGEFKPQKKGSGTGSSMPRDAFSLSGAMRKRLEVRETLKKHRVKGGRRKELTESGESGQLVKGEKGKYYLTEKKLPFTKEQMQEFLEKFMDSQHQGETKETRGKKVGLQKLDYSKMGALTEQLEDLRMVRKTSKGIQLQGKAIGWLLRKLIAKDFRHTDHNRPKKERIKDKTSVRRYMKGDTYKDISMRHTLKALVRHGKKLNDVGSREFRSFEKKRLSNMDIVLCIDVSESMGSHAKLRYAKLAAAGIAKSAIENGERIGLVAFSNSATTINKVTNKEHEITNALVEMEPHQFTNVGDGIKRALELLLKDKAPNKKQIIIISDGIPNISPGDKSASPSRHASGYSDMVHFGSSLGLGSDQERSAEHDSMSNEVALMFKELMGSRHATKEARKAREKNVEISFLYISSEEKRGEFFAKKIARIGRGKFYNVKRLSDLPLKALELV
ncbi:MAG: VWA domain-containing protein [Deltaproteobacteria bacterium]|nr:VWA domain-containing protein [Deltaproteobacteria bacterium]